MIDQVAIATATAAAGNVIAYMLNGHVDVLKGKVAQLFRRSNEEDKVKVLKQLNDDSLALTRETRSEAELKSKWSAMFTALLAASPEICDELDSFANAPASGKAVSVGTQNNYGAGTFIGGDNHGDINVSGSNDR